MNQIIRDIKQSWRVLHKNPGFTLVALLSLSLGIGANTAIFSVFKGLILNPFGFAKDPDRLVRLTFNYADGLDFGSFSWPDYRDVKELNTVLTDLAASRMTPMNLRTPDSEDRVMGEMVTANFFDTLGVKPILGRGFMQDEEVTPGASPVVVIGFDFWQQRFAGDVGVIGQTLHLNGHAFDVVGVAPDGFNGVSPLAPTIWAPIMMQSQLMPQEGFFENRGSRGMSVFGRMKPGIDREIAAASLETIIRNLEKDFPGNYQGVSMVTSLINQASMPDRMRLPAIGFFSLLMVVVGMVLLISCANLANILLARNVARRKEIGIRIAIGASRWDLVRQLMTESFCLSLIAGIMGVGLSVWIVALLPSIAPESPFPIGLEASVNFPVLVFAFVISTVTCLAFGLVPALQSTRLNLVNYLKGETEETGKRKHFFRNSLVVVQVAMALVLLVVAGLFIRNLQGSHKIDPGFDLDRILTAGYDLDLQGYDPERGMQFHEQFIRRGSTLPGVESISISRTIPLGLMAVGGWTTGVRVEGYETQMANNYVNMDYNDVGPEYFRTMGISLLSGREFSFQDNGDQPQRIVVNETFAKQFWPNDDAVGKQVFFGETPVEVIGVVADSKLRTLGESPMPYMYRCVLHDKSYRGEMTIQVRTGGSPESVAPSVRGLLREMDPDLPIYQIVSLKRQARFSLYPAEMGARFLSLFGALALALASIGIYGVLAYSVSRRTREIGIRMALGADRRSVVGMIMKQGGGMVGVGISIGLVVALALTRLLSDFLYGTSASDLTTFLATPIILVGVALIAVFVPANRATRINPTQALRQE